MALSFLGLTKREFMNTSPRVLISMIIAWKEIKYGKEKPSGKKTLKGKALFDLM